MTFPPNKRSEKILDPDGRTAQKKKTKGLLENNIYTIYMIATNPILSTSIQHHNNVYIHLCDLHFSFIRCYYPNSICQTAPKAQYIRSYICLWAVFLLLLYSLCICMCFGVVLLNFFLSCALVNNSVCLPPFHHRVPEFDAEVNINVKTVLLFDSACSNVGVTSHKCIET